MNITANRATRPAGTPPITPAAPRPIRPQSYRWVYVLFIAGGVLGYWAWDRFVRLSAFGLVEIDTLTIAAPYDGYIESMPVQIDQSYPGEHPAFRIETRDIQDQIIALQLELAVIESQIEEKRVTLQLHHSDRLYERDRYLVARRAELEEARRELGGVAAEIARTNAALSAAQWNFDQLELLGRTGAADGKERVQARTIVRGLEDQLQALLESHAAAGARVDALRDAIQRPVPEAPDLTRLVHPLQQKAELIRQQIVNLKSQLQELQVTLPTPCTISDIIRRPGELVRQGDPVLLAKLPESVRVAAYFEQRHAEAIRRGQRVAIVSSYGPAVTGVVNSVGPALEMAPPEIAAMHPAHTPLLPILITIDAVGREKLVAGSVVRVYPED